MDAGLLSRRQDLSIQTAELDVDVSVVLAVLRAYETVKAKGVVKGGESSVEEGHLPEATGVILRHGFLSPWVPAPITPVELPVRCSSDLPRHPSAAKVRNLIRTEEG
jgi:hypothetical protein